MGAAQAHVGHGTGQPKLCPVVCSVSNLISLLVPGDALQEEGLTLPGCPQGIPNITSSTDFGVILSDFCVFTLLQEQ